MAIASGFQLNGPALREIRKAKGRTVTDCAQEIGVTQGTWSNWEAGRRRAAGHHVQRITQILLIEDVRAIIWPDTNTTVILTDGSAA